MSIESNINKFADQLVECQKQILLSKVEETKEVGELQNYLVKNKAQLDVDEVMKIDRKIFSKRQDYAIIRETAYASYKTILKTVESFGFNPQHIKQEADRRLLQELSNGK
ncbi:hypothetical protein COF68_05965 [Bacillus toyonensis]|uniref:hypothetical protein n=1 Tax=Bacillus toyonensis TaxID=155322 RepID=UPI000BFC39CE|nr:hypothetical protein [Bacillus toyonensis]PHE64381.1 hypothetical protein COF68_05965 [Bacillus toyonensis]